MVRLVPLSFHSSCDNIEAVKEPVALTPVHHLPQLTLIACLHAIDFAPHSVLYRVILMRSNYAFVNAELLFFFYCSSWPYCC